MTYKHNIFYVNLKKNKLEPAIIWKPVTCQRITSKRFSTSMSRHLSQRYGQVILVSGYPVLTAVNWTHCWCAICVQYQSSCAPKPARKCGLNIGWPVVRTDGQRAGGVRSRDYQMFLGWVDFLTHGAPQARFARQSSAINNVFVYIKVICENSCTFRIHF